MNFNSTDEDELTPPLLVKDNNDEYVETCGDEIKDIVPRLQRLNVNDEQWDLRSEILNKPSSAETIPMLMNIDDEISVADLSVQVSPVALNCMPGKISINDGIKSARGKEKSLSTSNEIAHVIPENIQVSNQSQDFVQNMPVNLSIHFHPVDQNDEHKVYECKEMNETGRRSLTQDFDQNMWAGLPIHMNPVNEIDEHKLLESEEIKETGGSRSTKTAEKNTKQVDPETGESSNTLSMILPDRQGNDRIDDKSERDILGQLDAIAGSPFNNKACSSDVSSDNQSNMDGGKLNISMSDTHNPGTPSTGLVESKRQRKIAVFANPAFPDISMSDTHNAGTPSTGLAESKRQRKIAVFANPAFPDISMSDTHNAGTLSTGLVESKRQRKIAVSANPASQITQSWFSTINTSSNLDGETLKANSFSEDVSKNSRVVKKDSPKKSRRRCRKIKPSTTPGFQISPDFDDEDEKRTSPCKRKHENLMETTGKLRRSCTSECNTEAQLTIEKTQSVLHSRSLSLGLKETNSSPKFSFNRKSRKRTSSDYHSVDRVKSRRSSSSSDGAENR